MFEFQIIRILLLLNRLRSKGIADGANGTPDTNIKSPVYWEGVLEGYSLRDRLNSVTKTEVAADASDLRPLEKHPDEEFLRRLRAAASEMLFDEEVWPSIRPSGFLDPAHYEGRPLHDQGFEIPQGQRYPGWLTRSAKRSRPHSRLRDLD